MICTLVRRLGELVGEAVAILIKILLRYDSFRKRFVYPRMGIKVDSSIKRTIHRPILHAEIDGGKYHFPIFANQTRIDNLRRSRLRETDILIVTYPKSGTHLCSYIVKLLAEKRARIMQDDMVVPFLEMVEQEKLDRVPADTQRIMKTHLPIELIPPCIDSQVHNKIIFCLRDPKDACVSYYKFSQQLDILTGPVYETFDEWVELWLGGYTDYGEWCDYVKPFWEQRFRDNILIVTYEEILEDPGRVIRQIAEHLAYNVEDKEVEEIKEKISFSNMKQELEKTGKKRASSLMRSGKTGESKKAFSDRHNRIFNRIFKEKMSGTGFHVYDY